jgi:stalled ribosome rescue protein Dom34
MSQKYEKSDRPPIKLTPEEEADLADAEAEIERGDIASSDEVRLMWAKHGPRHPK